MGVARLQTVPVDNQKPARRLKYNSCSNFSQSFFRGIDNGEFLLIVLNARPLEAEDLNPKRLSVEVCRQILGVWVGICYFLG